MCASCHPSDGHAVMFSENRDERTSSCSSTALSRPVWHAVVPAIHKALTRETMAQSHHPSFDHVLSHMFSSFSPKQRDSVGQLQVLERGRVEIARMRLREAGPRAAGGLHSQDPALPAARVRRSRLLVRVDRRHTGHRDGRRQGEIFALRCSSAEAAARVAETAALERLGRKNP